MRVRYIIIPLDGDITGTNNEKVAIAAAQFETVIDAQEGASLNTQVGGSCTATPLEEETTYQPA